MTEEQATSELLFDFVDEVLQQYFGPEHGSAARVERSDVESLLTDDTRRRVAQARVAAMEWGRTEVAGVVIASDRLVITPRGVLYAAGMSAPGARRPLYYLATPIELFESIVDRVEVTSQRHLSVAAVDDRFGSDLTFPWPLDTALRRMLDAHQILHLELGDEASVPPVPGR
ncbi:glucose-6-phosphate dehydrogenase [Aldersonia sp. NBC_00410]|uniref:glucose-6-phosphate dehydrogenase n=1 Tax=Aldersonia sp. NBC_00410 TaxID=2975954 RepID=UPI00224DAD61|nr:glucose-6-phosphate dehydrogenase [Aldersonia sp. NBC_00410]MCX5046373.1 glucose-6-phosphate dehydrogenase [Aldersonia sp. NBC_00410]